MARKPTRASVQLTDAALEDLHRLKRRNPATLRAVFAKLIELETHPKAGAPLGGDLHGYRKITVGNRSWRIIWRVVTIDGATVVDVVEVWAVGARANNEVYDEMRRRLAAAPAGPATSALAQAVAMLARREWDLSPDAGPEPLPTWLVERLTNQAGLPLPSVLEMSLQQAVDAWAAWVSQPR